MTNFDRLTSLLSRIDERIENFANPTLTSDNTELFLVTTAWLTAGVRHARGVTELLRNDMWDVVGPLQRALYELRNELRYLLHFGDPRLNARRVMISGVLESREFLLKRDPDNPTLANVERVLDDHRRTDPELVAEMESRRAGRKWHWTGLTVSKVEMAVTDGSTLYKALSWDAHTSLVAVRDIQIRRTDNSVGFVFGRRLDHFSNPEYRAWLTGALLFDMWQQFAERWNLAPIEPTTQG